MDWEKSSESQQKCNFSIESIKFQDRTLEIQWVAIESITLLTGYFNKLIILYALLLFNSLMKTANDEL